MKIQYIDQKDRESNAWRSLAELRMEFIEWLAEKLGITNLSELINEFEEFEEKLNDADLK